MSHTFVEDIKHYFSLFYNTRMANILASRKAWIHFRTTNHYLKKSCNFQLHVSHTRIVSVTIETRTKSPMIDSYLVCLFWFSWVEEGVLRGIICSYLPRCNDCKVRALVGLAEGRPARLFPCPEQVVDDTPGADRYKREAQHQRQLTRTHPHLACYIHWN